MRCDGVIEDAGLLVLVRGHEVVLVQLQGHSRQNNFLLRSLMQSVYWRYFKIHDADTDTTLFRLFNILVIL